MTSFNKRSPSGQNLIYTNVPTSIVTDDGSEVAQISTLDDGADSSGVAINTLEIETGYSYDCYIIITGYSSAGSPVVESNFRVRVNRAPSGNAAEYGESPTITYDPDPGSVTFAYTISNNVLTITKENASAIQLVWHSEIVWTRKATP